MTLKLREIESKTGITRLWKIDLVSLFEEDKQVMPQPWNSTVSTVHFRSILFSVSFVSLFLVPFTTSKSSIDQEMSKPEIRIKSEPFPPPDDDYIGIGNDFGLPSPIVVPKSLDNDNGEPLESVTVHDDIRGVDSFHTEKSNGAPRRSRPAAPASFNFKVPEVPRFSVENKPIADWSVAEVAAFLTHRGFPDAAAKILERQVDGRRLLGALDPLMLKKMEIPIGPGLKITKLMRDLQKLWVGSV